MKGGDLFPPCTVRSGLDFILEEPCLFIPLPPEYDSYKPTLAFSPQPHSGFFNAVLTPLGPIYLFCEVRQILAPKFPPVFWIAFEFDENFC